jgi:hypothetical protein
MASSVLNYIQEVQDQELSIQTLHFKEKFTDSDGSSMILLSDAITEKYKDDLAEIVYLKTFTPVEMKKYIYNPQLLSYDLYGTPEFWFLLLDLNALYSFSEFNLNPVKVYNSNLSSVLSKILNLEKETIDLNVEEINS